ncbi:hypothetical protein H483_0110880 [Dietzia sp. UCD-THP]|uniref:hypothetical protein n=1 Tax=Dietzia sp. UCD-THP TaxID=1292020 RepID=UPI0003810F1B|nr:hypothetical protein [Dietzia sp. UCD-THP]EYT62368.1 hypothetical protein H483_0110880 [Dietzia sp. UCD-THP]
MPPYTPPSPHRAPLPTRTPARTKRIPRVRNRIGALTAFAGLAVSLLSLFLPWLSAGGERISGLGITEIIDVRSVAPVLFLGLIVLALLVTVTALTRLGAFAVAAAVMAVGVLAGHLAFVWTLILSTGSTTRALSGLPANATVTFGPYVAASGFVVVAAASAWAARSARYASDPLSRRE